jgi:ArsR family transcriptional regulator
MNDREIVRMLKALGDETRFQIVREVAAAGELSCGQLVEASGLAQPTVSHHMKILVDAGALVVRVEGKHHFVSVNHALLGSLRELVRVRLSPPRGEAQRASRAKKSASR